MSYLFTSLILDIVVLFVYVRVNSAKVRLHKEVQGTYRGSLRLRETILS